MQFSINKSLEVLDRTPRIITGMLIGVSDDWVRSNEGPDTWSPYDIVGHLIHGEKTDWIPRMEIILSDGPEKTFQPFDRFAQFRESQNRTMPQLLEEFTELRVKNVAILRSKNISDKLLNKTGVHPKFGEVTLSQLLATWAVHDLNHIGQMARVMAKQYASEVGPWTEFLRILKS
jgi:hypothetical protein